MSSNDKGAFFQSLHRAVSSVLHPPVESAPRRETIARGRPSSRSVGRSGRSRRGMAVHLSQAEDQCRQQHLCKHLPDLRAQT